MRFAGRALWSEILPKLARLVKLKNCERNSSFWRSPKLKNFESDEARKRVKITVAPGVSATLLESYRGRGGYLADTALSITLGEGARAPCQDRASRGRDRSAAREPEIGLVVFAQAKGLVETARGEERLSRRMSGQLGPAGGQVGHDRGALGRGKARP